MKVLQKKWCLQNSFVLLLLMQGFVKAQSFQNLVPNGSFETYTQCPNNSSQVYFAPPWTGPTSNSSDYFNSCSSSMNVPHYGGIGSFYPYYLDALDGQAYVGIQIYNSINYREYIQVELTDSLKHDNCYFVEFYATNSQRATHAVNNISAYLSQVPFPSTLTASNSLLTIPSHITNFGNKIIKDTVKWEKVSGIYEAAGNEKYIIIGNFNSGNNTDTFRIYALGTGPTGFANVAYIFIDAVSIYSINPHGSVPWSYQDTTINEGDSVFIGNTMGGNFNPQWFTANGSYIATNAGIVVSPTLTSNYVVQYTLCSVVRSDTVKVTVIPAIQVGINELIRMKDDLRIYPIPAQDFVELKISQFDLFKDVKSVLIYDNLGQLLNEQKINFENKFVRITTSGLPNGIYFLRIKCGDVNCVYKRFVVGR